MPTSTFQPIRLLDPDYGYKVTCLMANSADPDQKPTDLDLHCLQKQGISGFSRTRVISTLWWNKDDGLITNWMAVPLTLMVSF